MKKLIVIVLTVILLLGLAACGAEEESNADFVITRGTAATEEAETEAAGGEAALQSAEGHSGPYGFAAEGVKLIPGEAFDVSQLPEAASVYQVPSCAIEGNDNVYNYETFELTAFDDGSGEVIYSIYLLDPSVTTPEGLALGDEAAKVIELFGEDYQLDGTAYVYTSGETMLSIIVQNDTVVSIEYTMTVG